MARTREEHIEYCRRYRIEHKEQIKESIKYYRQIHRDKYQSPEYKARQKELHKIWVENNREKYNAYHREYRRKRREMQSG